MSSDLIYHVGSETRNGKSILIIRLSEKREKKDLLQIKNPQEKKALEFLIQEDLRKGKESSPFSHFEIGANRAYEALKYLSLVRRLHFGDSKLFFDPFCRLSFSYVISDLGQDQIEIRGEWNTDKDRGWIDESSWLFLSDPPLLIKHSTLYAFSEGIDLEWYSLIYSKPLITKATQLQRWQKEWERDPLFAPKILQKTAVKELLAYTDVSVLPSLELTDRMGAFANLWMDYGDLGRFRFDDPIRAPFRDLQAEKSWEKDLLETDFLKKIVDKSHYYCPLDKVAKSLTFLLEIGWRVMDYQGRSVVRQKGRQLEIQMEENKILLKGKIDYAGHLADLTHLIGAFNRREQFLSLDSQTVGLIDRADTEEAFGGISLEEISKDAVCIRKNRFAQLEGLAKEAVLSEPFSQLLHLADLKNAPAISHSPPTDRFQGTLFSYQQLGVDWLCYLKQLGFSGLLADEMGLGKTVQVLAFFSHLHHRLPTLVVAPTSLLFNWRQEIEKFLPQANLHVHHGSERKGIPSCDILLTSYSLLRQDLELFQEMEFEVIVLDEGQYIKNPDSQISQAVFSLRGEMKLLLSGTPIENRWEDLWSLFHFLMPDLLGERKEFSSKMAAAELDSRYLLQTKKKVQPFLLRRKKIDVAIDLPEKISQTVWVEMSDSQKAVYDTWVKSNQMGLLKKVSLEGASSHRMEILEAILRLRQICAHPYLVDATLEEEPLALSAKMQRVMTDLEEAVSLGKKVLIYSQFTTMLALIRKQIPPHFPKHVYLDGSTSNREELVKQFQEDPDTLIFLISLKAGGVGLNLTAADYVFLYDPWWNEAVENQAIDRAHRLGRKDVVIARRYVTAMSIEEKLMHLKKRKSGLAEGLLDFQEEMAALSLEDLQDLLR